jgi:hypothetical protein
MGGLSGHPERCGDLCPSGSRAAVHVNAALDPLSDQNPQPLPGRERAQRPLFARDRGSRLNPGMESVECTPGQTLDRSGSGGHLSMRVSSAFQVIQNGLAAPSPPRLIKLRRRSWVLATISSTWAAASAGFDVGCLRLDHCGTVVGPAVGAATSVDPTDLVTAPPSPPTWPIHVSRPPAAPNTSSVHCQDRLTRSIDTLRVGSRSRPRSGCEQPRRPRGRFHRRHTPPW